MTFAAGACIAGGDPNPYSKNTLKDGLLDTRQAARILGCSAHEVRYLARQGLLPVAQRGEEVPVRHVYFRREDLELYLDSRVPRVSLPLAAKWAREAVTKAAVLETKLQELYGLLGLELALLPTDSAAVLGLCNRAIERTASDEQTSQYELQEWAGLLRSIDGTYLDHLAVVALDDEPWRPFLELAAHLLKSVASTIVAGQALPLYVAGFIRARDSLQACSYLWVVKHHGARRADQQFIETTDDELIALMR